MATRRAGGGPYGPDLAAVHHDGFRAMAEAAASTITGRLWHTGRRAGLVVDLGCGSGALAARVTNLGFDVTGYDLSDAMLKLARANAPKAKLAKASVYDVEVPACVAVAAIGEVFNYSFDESAGVERLRTVVGRVHDALAPGGFFVFDVAGPGRAPGGSTQAFRQGDGWAVGSVATEARGRLTRDITVFVHRDADAYERADERHELVLYRPDEIGRLLDEAGFEWKRLRAYGPERLGPGVTGFLAVKAGSVG